jgi:methyltransferase (TIGR00027 family)
VRKRPEAVVSSPMATDSPHPLTHISDTATWVAMYRALESERPDALFRDTHARRLAGPQGEEILRRLPRARQFAWPMVVRTAVMDELILRLITRDGVDTVVNLAAGLDTRPYRLPLAASLRWVEADFPDVIDYKERLLAQERPACVLERRKIDLTDDARRRSFFAEVGAAARRAVVITEGLLIYLTREQVTALARDLSGQRSVVYWITDLATPRLLKLMEKSWNKPLAQAGAPFQFAPPEGTQFFEPLGWREVEWRSMWDESLRLKRTMRLAWLWTMIGRFMSEAKREEGRRMSGVALLARP